MGDTTFIIKEEKENFIQDAYNLHKALQGKLDIFVVGFANINRPQSYLKKVGLTLTGVIDEKHIAELRGSATAVRVQKSLSATQFKKYKLDELTNQSRATVIMVADETHDQYQKACNFIKGKIGEQKEQIILYSSKSLKYFAIINGKYRVINNKEYFLTWPSFMQMSHPEVSQNDYKLFIEETTSKTAVLSNGYSYQKAEYHGKFFNTNNGKRETCYGEHLQNPKKKILLFGDSKINGFKLSDEETVASQLQLSLNKYELEWKVEQLAYSGAEAIGSLLQLQYEHIDQNTIVLCSSCARGIYRDADELKAQSEEVQALHYAFAIQQMYHYCLERSIPFIFFTIGRGMRIANPTITEQFILDAYNISNYNEIDVAMQTIKKYCIANTIPYFDLSYLLMKHDRCNYLTDSTHFSPEAARDIAKELCDILRYMPGEIDPTISQTIENNIKNFREQIQMDIKKKFETPELIVYLENLKKISAGKSANSGVIVMNCNPFTLGHRYLIETARSQVDQLYILVVEEDLSIFKFQDRFEMVKQGVADLPNVEVLPSGKFVISVTTFPDYFDKDAKQNSTIDPTLDVEIFCNRIAPALAVKKRFVGEEPLDLVTNQYNQKMAELLPKHEMELIVIPRKEINSAPISASRVRKLLNEGKKKEILTLIPQTTYDYLLKLGY